MRTKISRRTALQAAGLAALAPHTVEAAGAASKSWPIVEGPDTPKLCLLIGDGGGPPANQGGSAAGNQGASLHRILQLGVNYVIGGGGGRLPWQEENLRASIQRAKDAGLTWYNMMIGVPANVLYGRAGRDADIEKLIASVQAAGKAGLPVIEYNFYAHRAMEGYFEETGRAGTGITGFDYEKMKGLPPLENEGAHTLDEMWNNIAYFLKAVIPAAEKANVRLALHPNDPPAPLSRGSQQIMGSLAGWKHLIEIVNSPANGITFDCGVTREMGEDPVAVCRYFASRKRINHMHFRNVRVMKPYERYQEVFIDEGMVDMFAVMREVVRNKYTGTIYPEHPRALDYDRDRGPIRGYPGGGGYGGFIYNVGYARAMLQAALESV
jgi:mannonate dehydratase